MGLTERVATAKQQNGKSMAQKARDTARAIDNILNSPIVCPALDGKANLLTADPGCIVSRQGATFKKSFMTTHSLQFLAIFLATSLLNGTLLLAQSTVVQIGRPTPTQSVSVKGPGQQSFPPSTATAKQRQWESILLRVNPEEFQGEMACGQVIKKLRKFGLPVVLDQSARDDSLMLDELISLDLPNEPLYVRLQTALIEKNSVLAIIGDSLRIISMDVGYSPEYFLAQSYDITALNVEGQSLADQIMGVITPEDWDDSGGYSTIKSIDINGSRILTVNAPYTTHRDVRAMLKGLFELQHNLASGSNEKTRKSALTSSRVIEIPIAKAIRKKRGKFTGGGIGGFGLGGGVF